MFRALQGVGAALLMPGTLSILTVTFPPEERARAIGMWAVVSGLALAL
jgi:MFS family permease